MIEHLKNALLEIGRSLNIFLLNSVIPDATAASSSSSEGDSWWLHMSPQRQAREKELFQKLVTHFYLVSS